MRGRIRKNFRRPADPDKEDASFKRVKKKRGGLRLIVRLSIAAAIAVAVFALFANWKELSPDSFVAWVEDVLGGTTGGSFPVALTGDNVSDMQEVGGNMVLLTDTATVYYNKNGGESVRRTCSYAKPLLRVAGRYAVVLETGGKRYRLETRSDIEIEKAIDGKIVTGAVSKKGDVAVVTETTQSHLSSVIVFARDGKQRYQWSTSEWMAMDVSFSSDGNSMSVVGCRAKNGEIQSTLLVFNLRDQDAHPKQYTADGTMYARVHYMNNGSVVAIGNTHLRFVNPTGELDKTVKQPDKEIVGFAFSDDGIACAMRAYGSQANGTLCLYSANGDEQYKQAYEGEFRDVCVAEDHFLLLTDRYVYEVSTAALVHKKAVEVDSLMVGAIDGKPLYLGLTAMKEILW